MDKKFTPAQEAAQQTAYIAYIRAAAAIACKRETRGMPAIMPRASVAKSQAGFIDIVVVLIFAIGSATFSHFITKSETAVACNKHGKVVMLEKTYTCAEVSKTALSMNAWK